MTKKSFLSHSRRRFAQGEDGQYVDLIGTYDPLSEPATVKIDAEKAKKWIGNGVQPTDKVRALLVKEGIMEPKNSV